MNFDAAPVIGYTYRSAKQNAHTELWAARHFAVGRAIAIATSLFVCDNHYSATPVLSQVKDKIS